MAYSAGHLVRVYYATGAGSAYSDEPLEEVDLTPRYPRYTVYRVAADAKQMLTDANTPVIQFDDEGDSNFAAVTPAEIWYGAGYFILSTPRLAADVGRVHSGNYLTETSIFACAKRTLDRTMGEEDVTVYGDEAITRTWTVKDWKASLDILDASVNATATSTGGVANSHITAEHVAGGVAGNGATFDLQDNDDLAITISVVSDDITVGLKTDGADPTGTALETVAALNADPDVAALGIVFKVADGETGAGVVADSGPYTLAGGLDPIDFPALQDGTRMCFRIYDNTTARVVNCGFGFITKISWPEGPTGVMKGTMDISGKQYPMWRVVG
jgi:hypothetical protein